MTLGARKKKIKPETTEKPPLKGEGMGRESHRRGTHPGRGRKPEGLTMEQPIHLLAELFVPLETSTSAKADTSPFRRGFATVAVIEK